MASMQGLVRDSVRQERLNSCSMGVYPNPNVSASKDSTSDDNQDRETNCFWNVSGKKQLVNLDGEVEKN